MVFFKVIPLLLGWMPYWLATFFVGFIFATFAVTFCSLVVRLLAFLRRW